MPEYYNGRIVFSGFYFGPLPAHASTHENGGSDEINVGGLSGVLADAQNPTTHASSHQSGGADSIKLDDLATPDDNTDLDATTGRHGLLPKLGGGTANFLRADGTWAAPGSGGGPYTYGTKTRAEMLALGGLTAGETVFCSTYNMPFYWSGNTWQCWGHTIELVNKSGSTLVEGDLVRVDPGNDNACDVTNILNDIDVIGPIVIGGANDAYVTIATSNIWDVLYTGVSPGSPSDWAYQSNTNKNATWSSSPVLGTFGQRVETGAAGLRRTWLFTKDPD